MIKALFVPLLLHVGLANRQVRLHWDGEVGIRQIERLAQVHGNENSTFVEGQAAPRGARWCARRIVKRRKPGKYNESAK